MNKKIIVALVMIGLVALSAVLTRGDTQVNMIFFSKKVLTSLLILAFSGIGIVIGMLLK